jgi:PAS domain S-box-containing protein
MSVTQESSVSSTTKGSVVVMGDAAGVIQSVSPGWRELLSLPLDTSTSKPIGSLLDHFEVDPSVVSYVSERFQSGELSQVEFPFTESGGRERWLEVHVNPVCDRAGDVIRFIAVVREITESIEGGAVAIEECDISRLVRACAVAEAPELGMRTSFDAAVGQDLPPAYAQPKLLAALVRHLIRCGSRVIADEWGTLSLTTGLVGLGEEPIGAQVLAAGMPVAPYLFIEVHDTGVTSLDEARARLTQPFLPGSHGLAHVGAGVRFPNAVQLVEALGGRVQLEHDESFGTAISIVLSA